jgi:hypothetical protein
MRRRGSGASDQPADLCNAGVFDGLNLDELGGADVMRFGRGEEGLEVDVPLCQQPHK